MIFCRNSHGRMPLPRCLVAAVMFLCAVQAGHTQDAPASNPDATRAEYETISNEITLSAERLERLADDIAGVKKDHASITASLIQSAKTERKLGEDIEVIGGKMEVLKRQEDGIRTSLAARSAVLAEVLGALQRMGLNPPPAILVKPEDALSSVRSAILLGAVVPELREETDILIADLRELSKVTASIEAERTRLTAAMEEQAAEKKRLELLMEEKVRLQSATELALVDERKRSAELASRAESLRDLIASAEREAAKRQAAEAAAQKALEEAERRHAELASLPVPKANRLVASTPFSLMRGQVALPVVGKVMRRFGSSDGNGGVMLGDMVATQSNAIVTAPMDGSVLYAGPFRSYGQLLILNAGDGYHVVLAGMTRINVAPGQSVLSGEPIGAMGEARVADMSNSGAEVATPELYVEFRKDGKPVDPAPWWADRISGRT
ncbi:murein hydrolase activator EnvC family protein [Oryzicola mucosus]